MFGHPKGLAILFFTEMWERFSFYGMKAILVLFMIKNVNGGLGWTETEALALYGWYNMLVYVSSIPGGLIADRLIGQKKSVMLGGLLLCAGHFLMAFPPLWAFYTALGLIIAGVGLLKPNISTMVGGLYAQNDPKREEGFTYFYMGINLGSLISTILVGYIGETYGWHYGFSLAGIGMLIGQMIFMYGQKYLTEVGNLVKKTEEEKKEAKVPLTMQEKDRLMVVAISFFIVFIFWVAFEQAGGLMTLYTDKYTDRSVFGLFNVPASVVQSLNPLFVLLFGPVVAHFWLSRSNKGQKSSAIFKMSIGTIVMGLGFLFMIAASMQKVVNGDQLVQASGLYWLVGAYLFHTIGELCLSPVALSFITKLTPKHLVASIMGIYFAVTGLSGKAAAWVGQLAGELGELSIFTGLTVFSVIVGLLFILLDKKLTQMTHGIDGSDILEKH
jgi:POT family proton-dependent oligopeptide transporter